MAKVPYMGEINDLGRFRERLQGKPVGEARPVGDSRIEVVYVVLKDDGELSRHDVEQAGEFAKAAAVQAGRMRDVAPR